MSECTYMEMGIVWNHGRQTYVVDGYTEQEYNDLHFNRREKKELAKLDRHERVGVIRTLTKMKDRKHSR